MAQYLHQASYTPEGWAALVKKPQNRVENVSAAVEKLGGRVDGMWLAFGDHDVVAVLDMPNAVSAAAISIAFAAGGAVNAVRTTPLLSFKEGVEAMRLAGMSAYVPPDYDDIGYG